MDLAKAFAASTAFEVPLSMGTIYVRPLTSHRIEALEELARSDGATDADVARETLRLAGRWNPDPDPHRWNKDDEEMEKKDGGFPQVHNVYTIQYGNTRPRDCAVAFFIDSARYWH